MGRDSYIDIDLSMFKVAPRAEHFGVKPQTIRNWDFKKKTPRRHVEKAWSFICKTFEQSR